MAGHTLVVNEPEALILTGAAAAEQAAFALAEQAATAVVTVGPRGAIAVAAGELHVAGGVAAGKAVDTTGAGDLFMAAYVWGGLRGLDAPERLRWAVLYASLSVTVPTATAGAITEAQLIEQAARRGLHGTGGLRVGPVIGKGGLRGMSSSVRPLMRGCCSRFWRRSWPAAAHRPAAAAATRRAKADEARESSRRSTSPRPATSR